MVDGGLNVKALSHTRRNSSRPESGIMDPKDLLRAKRRRSDERKARRWDKVVMIFLGLLLLVPMPFIRFKAWPSKELLLERPVLPWSTFRICSLWHGSEDPVEEIYKFNWRGSLNPEIPGFLHPVALESCKMPYLVWQKQPAIPLRRLYEKGEFLLVKTSWRPILAWPLGMIVSSWRGHSSGFHGGGAN